MNLFPRNLPGADSATGGLDEKLLNRIDAIYFRSSPEPMNILDSPPICAFPDVST
jgi:hypothetical protein